MSTHEQYKEAKEAFVSQLQGGSVTRINAVSLTALTTYGLWAVLRNRGLTLAHDERRAARRRGKSASEQSILTTWTAELGVLVVPVILACTVLADHLVSLNAIIVAACAYVLIRYPPPTHVASPSSNEARKTKKDHWSKVSDDEEDEDEERERVVGVQKTTLGSPALDEPLRVSVDSAGDAARAAAAAPSRFMPPSAKGGGRSMSSEFYHGSGSVDDGSSSSSLGVFIPNGQVAAPNHAASNHAAPYSSPSKISHRSSPSLARSAAPLPGTSGQNRRPINAFVPRNQPFLTVYRAHMMLMTIICILAVDFKAFPREFAKCETWGTSLMDLGVGSFVFSLGIISALPLLRSPSQRFKPMRYQLFRDARRSLPLIILGGIRVLMVKGTHYPEHVSEYGVHWNFFITLAILPFFGTLCRPIARIARYSTVGLLMSCSHQALLSFTDLGGWASSNRIARNSIVSQNKEGLASLPGYLAIFLLGLDLGHYLLPRDPYLAYRRPSTSRQREKTDKLAMVLASYSIIWWAAHYLQKLVMGGQVSRRLANLPYVLWVTAYNTSFLLAYVAIYMVLLQPLDERALRGGTVKGKGPVAEEEEEEAYAGQGDGSAKTPSLLQALNANAFAVFLAANLLTGLVNVSMQTIYASDFVALAILIVYVSACLALASLAHYRGWRVKI